MPAQPGEPDFGPVHGQCLRHGVLFAINAQLGVTDAQPVTRFHELAVFAGPRPVLVAVQAVVIIDQPAIASLHQAQMVR